MSRPKKTPVGRPSLQGYHRKPRAYKRSSVTLQVKVDAVEFFARTGSMHRTLELFFPLLSPVAKETKRKRIYAWRKEIDDLKPLCSSKAMAAKRYVRQQTVGTVLSVEAEREIVEWINALRKEGVPVSAFMLKIQALQVSEEHGVEGFAASWSWRQRFRKRHGMSIRARTRQGQVTPEDADRIAREFAATVLAEMKRLGVSKVYNADQTGEF
jgi:hypothetical protein